MASDWNEHYAGGFTPWDTGVADPLLMQMVESGALPTGRALDVGCGTGGNAIWLAQHGYTVLGVDVAPLAIEKAQQRLPAGLPCRFATLDFLAAEPTGGPFQLVFDRGCWHVFDEPEQRARVAARVAAVLAPDGMWLSLIGSTEGPARDIGPPRRSLRDVVAAIEPHLELVSVRSAEFRDTPEPAMAWICLSRRRAVAAQPSSRHA
ncbi:MAG TPA: class I SAM-dependent methyltransferase [Planctomycetota bacterium]|nr:class I SAM-dependent methyltransferase [Planctomycetota bacterium]